MVAHVHEQPVRALVHGQGLGVEASAEQAARYYGRACESGHPLGCRNLGLMHALGRDVAS